ncbi:4-oxalomesaconate tautomerase [Actinomadura hibisca]|uniref:4-oxalomesaconate tautomerase n=1 Tax=Actinomadura hibisca TaxID=68565 RepID=UPI00082E5DE2|nr:4-oxalomesaconate tautomerase [Actinomadura hibisca]
MTGVPCLLMRGGTSKGAYFLAADLPTDPAERDDLLLQIVGSPDPRQIDGIGGGHPLTTKVAVVAPSTRPDADVDYLFLQPALETATVSDRQNCGNILAGVGPFAVERGLVAPGPASTTVRVHMVNSGSVAAATFPTPGGTVAYDGGTAISGVPGTAAPVRLDFTGTEGSACGALLPTGNRRDVIDGIEVTCIDNGMPVVIAAAADLGLTGAETVDELTAPDVTRRVQSLRVQAGELMGLGDVRGTSVPKTTLVSAPRAGGTLATRTFIPLEPHTSIGVLGAITVGTAALLAGTTAHAVARPAGDRLSVEHPTGTLEVSVELDAASARVLRSGVIRTARKLFDGTVFPRSQESA